MMDSYAQQAEAEMWDAIAAQDHEYEVERREAEPVDDGTEPCDGCNGSGIYYGRGAVVNGVFKGFTGTCYRCGGKGRQTAKDVKRNRYYDNHVRRFTA